MKIAITGATGYIGKRLVHLMQGQDYEVLALSRHRPLFHVSDWFQYEIDSSKSILPDQIDIIIHLAANTTGLSGSEEQEVKAAVDLLDHAKKCNAKFIFISSQTAVENAKTSYGKTKWAIEKEVLAQEGIVVRPGQVYGGELRGLYGRMAKFVKLMPLLPAFVPAPRIQPVHVDDLVIAIQKLIQGFGKSGTIYSIGHSEPQTFTAFISALAKYRLRLRRVMVPVPSFCVSLLARISSSKSVWNQLNSLLSLKAMNTTDSLKELELDLRSLESGMQSSGRGRRALLLEALTLYRYVLDAKPRKSSLRIYVRAIEDLRNGKVQGLPSASILFPSMLGLLDKSNLGNRRWNKELDWRIDTATALAEATPLGARQFLGLGRPSGIIFGFWDVLRVVMAETFWRLIRFLLIPFSIFYRRRPDSNDEA